MLSRSHLLVVAAAAMLVLAGCSGGPGTGTTDPGTDAPTTDPGGTTGGDAGDFGGIDTPGYLRADGIDAQSLVNAHYASLAGESYRVDTYQNSTGLLSLERTGTQRVAADGTRIIEYDTVTSNGNSTTNAFVNGSWIVTENTNETRTVHSAYRTDQTAANVNNSQSLVEYVRLGNYSVNRTFTVDGETRIEYVASGPADVQGAGAIETFEGRIVVSTDGRIHSLTVNATQQADYGTARSHYEYRLTAVGDVDASTPAWVADAMQAATVADLEYRYNGSVIAIEHTGGDAIEAGTQIVLQPTEGRGVGYGSLAEDFEPGETIYITGGDGRQLDITKGSPPAPTTSFGGALDFVAQTGAGEIVVRTTLGVTTNGSVAATAPTGFVGSTATDGSMTTAGSSATPGLAGLQSDGPGTVAVQPRR
jgi:hypothetical protein